MDQWPAFLSGIVLALIGVIATDVFSRRTARRQRMEEVRFQIYMELMELNSAYFWVTASEFHGERPKREILKRCRDLAWRIADKLRSADEVEYLDEILDVTLGSGFPTATARHDAMGTLLEKIGKLVNPRYSKKIAEISRDNLHRLASDGMKGLDAPGSFNMLEVAGDEDEDYDPRERVTRRERAQRSRNATSSDRTVSTEGGAERQT